MVSLTDKLKSQNANANQQNKQADVKPDPVQEFVDRETTPEPKEDEFVYATPHSDGLRFHFADGSNVQSEDGRMVLNAVQHKEIQDLIHKHKRSDIRQQMVYVDQAEAERIAAEHMAKHPRPMAIRGAASTALRTESARQVGEAIPEKLRNLDVQESEISHGSDGPLDGHRSA